MFAVGERNNELPEPSNVPLQLPEYHCQEAPVPKVPFFTAKLVGLPEQKTFGLATADVGFVDKIPTVIAIEAQVVVLQVPSALTQ